MSYAKTARYRWKVSIEPLWPGKRYSLPHESKVVRVDLTEEDSRALINALRRARLWSAHYRRQAGSYLTTAQVASMIDVRQDAIGGWLARGLPAGHPFPLPDMTIAGRNVWEKVTIELTWPPPGARRCLEPTFGRRPASRRLDV